MVATSCVSFFSDIGFSIKQMGCFWRGVGYLPREGGKENSPETALLPQVMLVRVGPCAVKRDPQSIFKLMSYFSISSPSL